ncbi:hypothetical protein JRO89_XS13G0000300 [Xanthoceras sorbifolium]|uniref:Histone deacetylase n=2 Tax=Magnoliopsida TaxID=3398 RepID=A0ABQ8H5Q2_9ROSI|nr:hypothetical protein JRO89_XS13G0000300 [Xanthoceras sorbifolium]
MHGQPSEPHHLDKPCNICGNFGRKDAIVTCSQCCIAREHVYCMRVHTKVIPRVWACEECLSRDDIVSPKSVQEDSFLDSRDIAHTAAPSKACVDSQRKFHHKKLKALETGKVKFLPVAEVLRLSSGAQGKESHGSNNSRVAMPSKHVIPKFPIPRVKANPGFKLSPHGGAQIIRKIDKQTATTSKKAKVLSLDFDLMVATVCSLCSAILKKVSCCADECDDKKWPFAVSVPAKEVNISKPKTKDVKKINANADYARNEASYGSSTPMCSISIRQTLHAVAGKKNSFEERDLLNIMPKLELYYQYFPSLGATWKTHLSVPEMPLSSLQSGGFLFSDTATVGEFCGGFQARPPCKIHCKAFEFSQKLPKYLQVKLLPRCSLWEDLFGDSTPDFHDIALYFLPADNTERSKHNYSCLFEFLETKNIVMRSYIDGVELLISTSKQLHVDSQKESSGMEVKSGESETIGRRVGLLYDERMCKHQTPDGDSHPENPNRITAIWNKLQNAAIPQRCVVLNAKEAEDKDILSVHAQNHVNLIRNISSKQFDSRRNKIASKFNSIYLNEGSSESAYLAAGSVIQLAESVAKGELNSAFAIVRPPGHHAEQDEAMGFCLYNNVAIAASYLLNQKPELGIKKILIVDWDVHHGNGTQKMFWKDSRVLFFSVHRHEFGTFYPANDDGFYNMIGEGPGAGYNINVPWENGQCGDADYLAVWDNILVPVAKEFDPDMIIISAGFDAAIGDPLGGCRVTPYGYSVMLKKLMDFAQGKILLALEGGYNLESISNSVLACMEVLLEDKPINRSSEAYPFESTWRVIQALMIPSSDSQSDDDESPYVSENLVAAVQDVIEPLLKLKVEDSQAQLVSETTPWRFELAKVEIWLEQFNDVLLQENALSCDKSSPLFDMTDLNSLTTKKSITLDALKKGWYRNIVYLGKERDIPIVTMTCPHTDAESFKSGKLPIRAPPVEIIWREFLWGAVAGAFGEGMMHPIDTVKTRIQKDVNVTAAVLFRRNVNAISNSEDWCCGVESSVDVSVNNKSSDVNQNSILQMVRTVWVADGLRGFYRGITPGIIGSLATGATYFGFIESTKKWIEESHPTLGGHWSHFIAGAVGDTLGSFVYVPCEVMKQRMQVQGTKTSWSSVVLKDNIPVKSSLQMYGYYKGICHAGCSIWKEQGLRGLYWSTLARDVPFAGLMAPGCVNVGYHSVQSGNLQVAFYEGLKDLTAYGKQRWIPSLDRYINSSIEGLVLGGLAGGFSAYLTTPMDVIKTRMQVQGSTVRYNGWLDAVHKIWMTEGPKGMFRGSIPRITWYIPASALTFMAVEFLRDNFNKRLEIDSTKEVTSLSIDKKGSIREEVA